MFFEEGNIILEMHDLLLAGHGMIRDPDMGHMEIIEFKGPITTGNIEIKPIETLNANGDMFPRFEIGEVSIVLDKLNTVVVAHGQTPLFKSHGFEEAVREWLMKES